MKKKKQAREMSSAKKFSLDNINELKFMVIIVRPEFEQDVQKRLEELGARILLSKVGEGISKNKSLELLGIQTEESILLFACARKEDADNMLIALDAEFNFTLPGNGLALTLDVEGYMGAKGLFI